MKEEIKDSVERSQRHVPEGPPPVSNIGSKIAFIFFIIGTILAIVVNYLYIPAIIVTTLFVMMVDSSRQLNRSLRREGQIRAEYIFGLAIGGFIVSTGLYIILTVSVLSTRIILAGMISTLVFFVYEYLLLVILRLNIDTSEIYVQKHPRKPAGRYYIFTEEKYIELVEDAALDNEFKPIG